MSARPDLIGQVSILETLLKTTAVPRYATSPFCGNDNASSLPNNVFGYGRINALAAVNAAIALPVELVAFSAEAEGHELVHAGDVEFVRRSGGGAGDERHACWCG